MQSLFSSCSRTARVLDSHIISLAFLTVIVIWLSVVPPAVLAQGAGYWHTSGSQILDSNGKVTRIAGVNWYGFETTDQVVHGLWAQDYHTILNDIKNLGYNVVRLPYSNQMVETPIVPSNISFANGSGPINTDLKGLNSLQVMDKVITAAGSIGLRVILDNHRSEAGNSAEQNGLWYTSSYPESAWINDWKTVTTRYINFTDASRNPTVIGMDLRNEPHLSANGSNSGSCWTGDTSTGGCPTSNTGQNWPGAAQRAGNAILGVNSNLLIFVEGVDCYSGDCDWWGGNLEGAKSNPVVLNTAGRLVYSAHDYGPNLFQQSWFNSNTTYSSLTSVWTKFWAYLSQNGTAPVWVGEFGTTNNAGDIQSSTPGSQGQWFQSLITFLQGNSSLNWTYWALNGEDSYGLLDNNYNSTPANSTKQSMLASIQFPLGGGGGGSCTAVPSTPSGLSAAAASSSQINLSWNAVSPPSGCSVTYSLFRSTTSGFTPSSSNQIASGLTSTSFSDTGLAASTTYYYLVQAVDSAGSSAASSQASATTQSVGGGGSTNFQITLQSISPNPSHVGQATNITVDFKNLASTSANVTLITQLQTSGGTVIASQSFTGSIMPQQTQNVQLSWSPTATGSYTVVGVVKNSSGQVTQSASVGTLTVN